MNVSELQRKLLAAARAEQPSDAVPYAFEKRIMSQLTARVATDVRTLWGRILWRAAASCVAVTLLLGVCSLVFADRNGSAETLAADLEYTVLAPFDNPGETW
jgi:hypothetical protein